MITDAEQRQPAGGGARVLYAVQGATDPPTFTLFVNRELPHHHLRYLERSIRDAFGFGSTPIKLQGPQEAGLMLARLAASGTVSACRGARAVRST